MVERVTKQQAAQPGGNYFPAAMRGTRFIRSGCTLLDCVLGGGWPLGRVSNVVGDRSVGKTLLAIEACANFAYQYPKGHLWYREAEAAFDEEYASTLGLPTDRVDFGPDGIGTPWDTMETVFEDMGNAIEEAKKSGQPGIYVLDSLDAVSTVASLKRDLDAGTYGLEKQKLLSQLFQQKVRGLKAANVHVMIISQIREKIGFVVGEKHTRSGGKALDFYATHIVWLRHIKQLTRTVNKIKRVTGVQVEAKAKKNKIAAPFGECVFNIRFGYGVDDYVASIDWLQSIGRLKDVGLSEAKVDAFIARLDDMPNGAERTVLLDELRDKTIAVWLDVEKSFAPPRPKYETS